jgi:hypothetical protein
VVAVLELMSAIAIGTRGSWVARRPARSGSAGWRDAVARRRTRAAELARRLVRTAIAMQRDRAGAARQ